MDLVVIIVFVILVTNGDALDGSQTVKNGAIREECVVPKDTVSLLFPKKSIIENDTLAASIRGDNKLKALDDSCECGDHIKYFYPIVKNASWFELIKTNRIIMQLKCDNMCICDGNTECYRTINRKVRQKQIFAPFCVKGVCDVYFGPAAMYLQLKDEGVQKMKRKDFSGLSPDTTPNVFKIARTVSCRGCPSATVYRNINKCYKVSVHPTQQNEAPTTREHPKVTPAKEEPTIGLIAELRDYIVKEHNRRRSSLALGKELQKTPNGTKLAPKGKSMYKLHWNYTLENMAQLRANNCDFGFNDTTLNFYVITKDKYENGDKDTQTITQKAIIDLSIKTWWRQLRNYGLGVSSRANTTHFARMAHDRATQIGCGINKACYTGNFLEEKGNNKSANFFVCHYDGGPLARNRRIYMQGEPCQPCDYYNDKKVECLKEEGLCDIIS